MVRLYTRVGDRGETGIRGGIRLPKDDPRIAANGDIDELNATLGLVQAHMGPEFHPLHEILLRVQHELFILGQEFMDDGHSRKPDHRIEAHHVERLEEEIETIFEPFRHLNNFVLPRGSILGAEMHLARTVARRAERSMRSLHRIQPLHEPALAYINRLSDMLFAMALQVNHVQGVAEIPPDYTR